MLQNGELNDILNIHKMHRQLEVQIHYIKLPVCIFSCLKMEHFDVDNNLTSLKVFSMIGTLFSSKWKQKSWIFMHLKVFLWNDTPTCLCMVHWERGVVE